MADDRHFRRAKLLKSRQRGVGTTLALSVSETCDGFDNDCDGATDEGCECINGASRGCGTDAGECTRGTQTCAAGRWGHWAGELLPLLETCDGLDNDCDGVLDEGCECVSGATRACSSPPGHGRGRSMGHRDAGAECTIRVQSCVAGRWAACTDDEAVEICDDDVDNDCDVDTDESDCVED